MRKKFEGTSDEIDWNLSEEELTNTLMSHHSSPLLFGVVEGDKVLEELEELGSLAKIRKRGYIDFRVDESTHVQHGDRFSLWGKHGSDQEEYLLFDIRTRSAFIDWTDGSKVKALFWDWLGFQDPKGTFTEDRPPLPGQEFPGLGVFRACTEILRRHVGETDAEVIASIPEFFHNAWLYKNFSFMEPEVEGEFRALASFVMPLGLSKASHAVHNGSVKHKSGEVYEWRPHQQVYPLSDKTKAYFESDRYTRTVEIFARSRLFTIT